MKALLSLALWAGLILIALAVIKARKSASSAAKNDNETWPVKARKTLLNANEQVVFNRLTEAFPDWIVLAQVALSQVVYVTAKDNKGGYRNRINQKVLDCVICRPDTSVVAVVEIDGNSHDDPRRSQSDATKDKALSDAGIKLIRINSKALPTGQQLREMAR